MIINRQAWVVVSDGGRANIYKNVGEIGEVKLVLVRSSNQHTEHTHEIGRDQPGRLSSNSGHAKSALESTDLHQVAASVAKVVVNEISKDYTHMAINELQKTLMNIH